MVHTCRMVACEETLDEGEGVDLPVPRALLVSQGKLEAGNQSRYVNCQSSWNTYVKFIKRRYLILFCRMYGPGRTVISSVRSARHPCRDFMDFSSALKKYFI